MQQRDLVGMYAGSRLTRTYWIAYTILCLNYVAEFFDFFIVAYLLAVIRPIWKLTYGQSSLILLAAGLGAIFGSLFSGALGDAFGRKRMLVFSLASCAVGAGAVAFLQDGAWISFAILRFFVGVGLSGCATTTTVMVVELTPLKYRKLMTGFPLTAASIGSLIATLTAATLTEYLGWRGVAAFGFVPLVLLVLVLIFVPESPLWLVSRRRSEDARRVFARLMDEPTDGIPVSAGTQDAPPPSGRIGELFAFPGRTIFTFLSWTALSTTNFGVYLWGPTILAMMLGVTPAASAGYFLIVAFTAIAGRIVLSLLPVRVSRRKLCAISGFCIAAALAGAGIMAKTLILGYPAFVLCIAAGSFFFDGIWVVLSPYVVGIFPTQLAARAVGAGQCGNGVGKIIGPLCLALIAGTGQLVTPTATTSAVLPSFLFLSACGLFFGLVFAFLLPEEGDGEGAGQGGRGPVAAPLEVTSHGGPAVRSAASG